MNNAELDRIMRAQRHIKCPCCRYIEYDTETGVVEYKWKPIHQWFHNKRIVYIKVRRKR